MDAETGRILNADHNTRGYTMTDYNPFEVATQQQRGLSVAANTSAVAVAERERAEIESAIVSAKKFPRNTAEAFTNLMQSCRRAKFAEFARYSFKRGQNKIAGPSVDLAREAARCWGNIRYGLKIVGQDEETIHIKGWALDLQTNSYVEMEDDFSKLIQRKNYESGKTEWVKPDERDLRELVNRRGAILVRNSILQILPPDLVAEAEALCVDTMEKAAKGELTQNPEDAVRRLALAFQAIGVSASMIEGWMGRSVSLVTDKELVELRGIYASIRDGNSQIENHFEVEKRAEKPTSDKTKTLNDRIKGAATAPPADPEPEPEPEPEPTETREPEPAPDPEEDGEDAVTLLVKEKERRLREEREAHVAKTKLRQEQLAKRKLD